MGKRVDGIRESLTDLDEVKKQRVLKEIEDAALGYTTLALRTLARICTRGDTDSARVSAANAILDRALGKPSQTIAHTGKNGKPLNMITPTMTPEEAEAEYASTLNAPPQKVASTLH